MRSLLSLFILCLFVLSTVMAPPLFASEKKGKLESFEEALEAPKSEEKKSITTESKSDLSGGEVATIGLIQVFANLFLAGLLQTGSDNWEDLYFELKANESPALPTFRLEGAYQYLTDKLNGVSGRVEAGYLMLGADVNYTQYFENDPKHDLKILGGHFLLRTLFADFIGINLALGAKQIWGQRRHTGFEFGLPIYLFFGKHFIVDAQPYYAIIRGKNVYDVQGGVSYKYKWFGVRAAYRAINTEGQTLHGPRAGLFVQW